MIIDCERCAARPAACGECVIGVLLAGGAPDTQPSGARGLTLDAPERRALDALAEGGLVPRLRLVDTRTRRRVSEEYESGADRDAG